jgi:polysaccharide pyruvyl transferase WcaK-like protein
VKTARRACKCKLIPFFAKWRERRQQKKIRLALENCLLVVVRDPETALALQKCGFHGSIVGADSTMLLETAEESPVQREKGICKIAFCLSSQNPPVHPSALRGLWECLCDDPAQRLVLIPMDCAMDGQLMDSLRRGLPHQERIQMLSCRDPGVIQASVANCDMVVSSRLTPLILAANVRTPIIGIESGGKISNWLRIFELKAVGTTEDCDFERVGEAISGFRADGGVAFRQKADFAYNLMRKRLALAEAELQSALENLKNQKSG